MAWYADLLILPPGLGPFLEEQRREERKEYSEENSVIGGGLTLEVGR